MINLLLDGIYGVFYWKWLLFHGCCLHSQSIEALPGVYEPIFCFEWEPPSDRNPILCFKCYNISAKCQYIQPVMYYLGNTFFLEIWHTKCIVNVQTQSEPYKTFKVYPPVFDAFLPIHLEKYSMTIKIPQELEIKVIKPTFYFFSLNFKFKALIWQKLKIRGLRFFMNWHIEDYLQTLDEIIIQLLRNSTHSKLLTLLPFRF